MTHHLQRARKQNLDLVARWVKDAQGQPINMSALIRKCCLVIGCNRRTAIQYIEDVTGDAVES